MYINDIHILLYVVIAILGLQIGQFINYVNVALVNKRLILKRQTFQDYKQVAKTNYFLKIITMIIYICLLYKFNLSLELLKYGILTPMLISVFITDLKTQTIPNRLALTIFEVGLIFVFVLGIQNLNIAKDMLLGMIVGGGVFLLITLIGGAIAGKEAMGLGDVKLMAALGLYLGAVNIALISIIAFIVGAIVSIVLLIIGKSKKDGYVPFGPFIVIATLITIFIPTGVLYTFLMKILSLGMY